MIVATGSVEYLKDQVRLLESIKAAKRNKPIFNNGWDMDAWGDEDEEKLNLVKELLKYKELYYKVERQLEELR